MVNDSLKIKTKLCNVCLSRKKRTLLKGLLKQLISGIMCKIETENKMSLQKCERFGPSDRIVENHFMTTDGPDGH